jgi:succinoglycan biosynthesis transport protein ExoP
VPHGAVRLGREGETVTAALIRGWWLIALVTALALSGSLLTLTVTPRTYEATATLQVPSASALSSSVRADDLAYTDRLVNTYKHIAELRDVRADVARRAGVPGAADLSVTIEPNTELVQVTARAGRAIDAARVANTGAAVLIEQVSAKAEAPAGKTRSATASELARVKRALARLQERRAAATDAAERAELEQAIKLREFDYQALSSQAAQINAARDTRGRTLLLLERADVPSAPASPRKRVILGLGLALGLAAGAALVLVLERRSPRLVTLAEIEAAAGSSVLGTVPRAPRGEQIGIFNGGSPQQEAFSALRARLLAEHEEWPHSLLVTSAEEGAGKSVIAANLAVALARARHRVVLVDLDMRRPRLHGLLGVENGHGTSDILRDTDPAMHTLPTGLHPTAEPRLDLITSGSAVDNPAELLASTRFAQMLHVLELRYEFVVIDAPALGPVSDAATVASQVDQVVLVVARTPVGDRRLREVVHQLHAIGARSVGVVVNRWSRVPRSAYLGGAR